MPIESVVRCDSYDQAALDQAITRHFEALGVEKMITPQTRVLIKPNLIVPRRPDTATTTHPGVVRAIAKWVRDHGAQSVVIADSPGGPHSTATLDAVYAASGLKALSDVATLNRDTGYQRVATPPGCAMAAYNIIDPVCEADLIINAAKLKTHSMTRLSAGVKNLFGCVPGLQKPEMHYANPDIESFSRMLIELARLVSPGITVIDAVDCMEGDGPTGGTVRHLGLILASDDMFSQDAFAARLIGIDPDDVVMLRQARERGWCKPEALTVVGDEPIAADPPFRLPRTASVDFTGSLPPFLRGIGRRLLRGVLRPLPRLDRSKCVGCGKCAESCPAHIITVRDRKAIFVKKGCISCFCCQEMCPAKAITVRRAFRR